MTYREALKEIAASPSKYVSAVDGLDAAAAIAREALMGSPSEEIEFTPSPEFLRANEQEFIAFVQTCRLLFARFVASNLERASQSSGPAAGDPGDGK